MIESELVTLGILFLFAIIGGLIASKFKQPAVIGLLLIGAIIGPNSLNLVQDQNIIGMMAEFGAILLLFVIGLEFVIPKLVKIGFKALLIGFLKIGIIFFMTYEFSLLLNFSRNIAVILGLLLSLSSTVVIIKILESKGLYYERREMPLLIGVLLIEDIFAVLVLTFLSGADNASNVFSIFENIVTAIIILTITYLIVIKISKIIVSWFIRNSGDEAVTFIALGSCVGFSYLAYFLGLSPSIGAFLAGSIVASLPEVKLLEHAIRPYALTFTSLFFISIGTMVDFLFLKNHIILILIFVALIVISRFFAVGIISYLFANFKNDQIIFSSLAMITVSEFSLLIAQSAMKLNLGIDLVSLTASIIFITALLMSISVNHYAKVSSLLDNTNHKRWTSHPKSLSNYIQLLFNQIDIESSNTNIFKKKFFRTLAYFILALFIFVGWRKLIIFQNIVWLVIINVVLLILMILVIYKIYKMTKIMYRTLTIIIADISFSRNIKRSRYILNNLLITIASFLAAIFFPLAIMLFDMHYLANIFPFALLIFVFLRLNKVINVINSFKSEIDNFPKYRKLSEVQKA